MAERRETICALASGSPPSAISLLRVSGPAVRDIAAACLNKGCPKPRLATLDCLISDKYETIDEGLMVFMPGPNSYTGEDTLELSLHGGRQVTELALNRLLECGARLAEPGEFTRRAFEAGKLDLTQAEAIADLIDAESEAQHAQAVRQMGGALSELYSGWRQDLTEILALLEASIDFPDEDDAPETVTAPVLRKLDHLLAHLEEALARGNLTERIRDGFRIAILGRPNAGKSTLLNRLAGREAAIVTDIPGTTRDVVEVRLAIGPYLVWVADTAGLRETDDVVEQEGVRRARLAAQESDLRIWVLDQSDTEFDLDGAIRPDDLVVLNKSDLVVKDQKSVSRETLALSAKTGSGLEALLAAIESRLASLVGTNEAPLLTRARHRTAIEDARLALIETRQGLQSDIGNELVAEHVRIAAYQLATLTGHVNVEDILGAVFSSFCIGK